MRRVVIVGGGFGGVKAARQLAKDRRVQVTLISEREDMVFYSLLYATATGSARSISSIPLSTIFEGMSVRLVHDSVIGLDRDRQCVVTTQGQYEYDDVICALGVVTNYFGIEGLEKYSLSIKSPDAVRLFQKHLHDELIETNHFDKHYIVAGAGPTGVELAASLKDYLLRVGKRHGLRQHRVNITLVEAAPRVLPRSHPRTSEAVLQRLKKLGVHVLLSTPVKQQDDDSLIVGDKDLETETVVWTSGVTNHPFYASQGHFRLDDKGKVIVNEFLEAFPHVFVLGDNAATPYSGLAQTALHDGLFVAKVIRRRLSHQTPPAYRPRQPFTVVPVGHRWATLERGPLRIYGLAAALLRQAADLIGYYDVLPLRKAVALWLKKYDPEEFDCPVCQKTTTPPVAPTP